MIKVRVLKDSSWAINPPHPGELHLTEGEERDDIPQQLIDRMLVCDTEYIEVLETSEETPEAPHVLDDVSDIRATLMEIVDNAVNKVDAKDDLEKWGKENLNVDINKRKKLEDIVAELIAEYEDQNG